MLEFHHHCTGSIEHGVKRRAIKATLVLVVVSLISWAATVVVNVGSATFLQPYPQAVALARVYVVGCIFC